MMYGVPRTPHSYVPDHVREHHLAHQILLNLGQLLCLLNCFFKCVAHIIVSIPYFLVRPDGGYTSTSISVPVTRTL